MKHCQFLRSALACLLCCAPAARGQAKLEALIIDGQNNHGVWPKATAMMRSYLEATGLFRVDVERTAFTWQGADLIAKYTPAGVRATTALPEPNAGCTAKTSFMTGCAVPLRK